MATVLIPQPLFKFTNNVQTIFCSGSSISELIDNLDFGYLGIRDYLCTSNGDLKPSISIFVNQIDIKFKDNLSTPISDTDQISIITP